MRFSRTKFARAAFAVIEITLVIAIIVLLAAMAVPSFLGARKRSQAAQTSNGPRVIDSGVKRYGIEHEKKTCNFIGA
jgi:type II secretory pathway pseudopilin PulG